MKTTYLLKRKKKQKKQNKKQKKKTLAQLFPTLVLIVNRARNIAS